VRWPTELGLPHIDTGALYRAAALACLRAEVDLGDEEACRAAVGAVQIDRVDDRTLLDGEDVEDEIRGDAVTAAVSMVSAHPGVRDALLPAQRRAVEPDGGVMEGRDIGSVVLPDADVKVFLTASPEERARRRAHQLGRDDVDVLAAQIAERDTRDAGRATSPLVKAEDAWELDSTGSRSRRSSPASSTGSARSSRRRLVGSTPCRSGPPCHASRSSAVPTSASRPS
jgi:cytidylate kinase